MGVVGCGGIVGNAYIFRLESTFCFIKLDFHTIVKFKYKTY